MCKHIHAVCKLLKAAHVEAETSETLVVDESQAWREIEANLHIEELGRSCISKSGNKEEGRTLLSQLALYLNDGEGDNEEEAAVIAEGLRVIKAKLAALTARKSVVGASSLHALNRTIQKEPSNKNLQKQMRFVTIKKPRRTQPLNSLAKPSSIERRCIGLTLVKPRLEVYDANTRSGEIEAVEKGYEKRGAGGSNGGGSSRGVRNEEAAVHMGAGGNDGEGGTRRGEQSECTTTSPIDCVSALYL